MRHVQRLRLLIARAWPAALCLLIGCSSTPGIVVQLETDLVAGADYAEARIVVEGVGAATAGEVHRATRLVQREEGREVRLAEITPLPAGDYRVSVELWSGFGSRVAANRVLTRVEGLTAVIVSVTADCAGITCPARGDPFDATFCFHGRCIPEACREDRAGPGCPDAECASDADCSSEVECAPARCDLGLCVTEASDERCPSGFLCSARLGCVALPGDAGPDDPGCTPGSCDDFNPCTDDACTDGSCAHTPNARGCDDGVFCNGADTCRGGLCDQHAGDPCAGVSACLEGARACEGETLCAADERVAGGACAPCPDGTTNAPGDDASGADTFCDPVLCGEDERVRGNACEACPAGSQNDAGDDASGADTSCDPILCAANQRVQGNACAPCPSGWTNAAGDDASGPDTTCDCAETELADTAAPWAEWYQGTAGFDAASAMLWEDRELYARTVPSRAADPVGGATRLVINEFIARQYVRNFRRTPDRAGFVFWIGEFERGFSFGELRDAFEAPTPAETTDRVTLRCGTPLDLSCTARTRLDPGNTNVRCVRGATYSRDASGAGTTAATTPGDTWFYLETVDRSRVVRDVSAGMLHDALAQVYDEDFGRAPDCAGLVYWAGEYAAQSWTITELQQFLRDGGGAELGPCGSATASCNDFTLDECGAVLVD